MSHALPDDKRDIDAILASIRAELGVTSSVSPATATDNRRLSGVTRVETLIESDDDSLLANRRSFSFEEFEALDELAFLHAAYRAVLGREIDESGLSHYLPALRDGHVAPDEILRALRASAEGQARGAEIAQLNSRPGVAFLMRVPVMGGLLRRLRRYLTLPQSTRRLQKRIAATDRRHREMVIAINDSLVGVRRSLQKLDQQSSDAQHRSEQALKIAQIASHDTTNASSELVAARRQLTVQSRELVQFLKAARSSLPPHAESETKVLATVADASLDTLYVAFENRFRGSTASITERLKRYLDLFREAAPVAAGGTVLDIGCGRGEWLGLLRDANVVARGIDLNGAMVAQARDQGLDVVEGDAIAFLNRTAEGSLAAVTGFHIVEHLAFRDLVAMFDAAFAALSDDGIILFETPNPENLVVGACTFHYDPTHNKPLPPDLLRFIAETRGFTDVRIIRRDEDCQLDQPESGFAPGDVNDWFQQPADYAVYGRKPAGDVAP